MAKQSVSLTKNGQEYMFRYDSGCEGLVIDEIIRIAQDAGTSLDWVDAATLGFQVTQFVAMDCCATIMKPPEISPVARESDGIDQGGDDAKDGPCTSSNYP